MLYLLMNENEVASVLSGNEVESYRGNPNLKCRWDWKSHEEVEALAAQVTKLTGSLHVGTDAGRGCYPRYDIIKAPAVGDKVSYSFNGDSYPDGEIVRITNTLNVITSTGSTYRRRKTTGSWRKAGGTWSLVQGHRDERNPHF